MKFKELQGNFRKVWTSSGAEALFNSHHFVESTTSTMDLARLELAQPRSKTSVAVERYCLATFASTQTAGRGREHRSWHSEAGTGIYVTYAWLFNKQIPKTEALSLAAGIAVYRFCQELGIGKVSLKWPNDVLVHSEGRYKKLAGVLTECSTRGTSYLEMYLGIGLNLAQESFPESVPGISIRQLLGSTPEYSLACAGLSLHVHSVMQEFFASGFAVLLDEYNKGSMMHNARVSIPGESMRLRAQAVNPDGGLRCVCEDSGIERVLYRADIELADSA